jgi:hypothetical protein
MAIAALAKLGAKALKKFKGGKTSTIKKIGDKNQRRIIAGGAAGAAVSSRKKPKASSTKKKIASGKTSAKTSSLKNIGKTTKVTPVKNAVRTKDGQIVRSKDGKAVTFGGANKGGAKSREGRMGGGMMKKRMKRGGRAK